MHLLDLFLADHPRADEVRRSIALGIVRYIEARGSGDPDAAQVFLSDDLSLQEKVDESIE